MIIFEEFFCIYTFLSENFESNSKLLFLHPCKLGVYNLNQNAITIIIFHCNFLLFIHHYNIGKIIHGKFNQTHHLSYLQLIVLNFRLVITVDYIIPLYNTFVPNPVYHHHHHHYHRVSWMQYTQFIGVAL